MAGVFCGRRVRAGGFAAGLVFVLVATVVLAGFGWLVGEGAPPGVTIRETAVTTTLPRWGVAALGVWMVSIAVVSLVLPAAALAVWGGDRNVRLALGPYALVLVLQILVEVAFAALFFPAIVVAIGLTFTLYRLRQLRFARRTLARADVSRGRAAVGGILVLGFGFWATNAAFLALVALPRVVLFP